MCNRDDIHRLPDIGPKHPTMKAKSASAPKRRAIHVPIPREVVVAVLTIGVDTDMKTVVLSRTHRANDTVDGTGAATRMAHPTRWWILANSG